MNIDFRRCPVCNGYGVLDDGRNCRECGGVGSGGLRGPGTIGSGEIMIDRDTGRRVTAAELVASRPSATADPEADAQAKALTDLLFGRTTR